LATSRFEAARRPVASKASRRWALQRRTLSRSSNATALAALHAEIDFISLRGEGCLPLLILPYAFALNVPRCQFHTANRYCCFISSSASPQIITSLIALALDAVLSTT